MISKNGFAFALNVFAGALALSSHHVAMAATLSDKEETAGIYQTSDGGYIIGGHTAGWQTRDAYLTKISAEGAIQWEKIFEGQGFDYIMGLTQVADGGYVLIGETYVNRPGLGSAWVLKVTAEGLFQWQQFFNRNEETEADAVTPTGDGGFAIAGRTRPNEFGHMGERAWVVKFDAEGKQEWENYFGKDDLTAASASIVTSAEGGFYLFGSEYVDGSAFLYKLDSVGRIVWKKNFAGVFPSTLVRTDDNGAVLTGTLVPERRQSSAWVARVDTQGMVIWEKIFQDKNLESATDVVKTNDGGFVVAGTWRDKNLMFGGDLLTKLDAHGEVQWRDDFGNETECRQARKVSLSSGDDVVVAGISTCTGEPYKGRKPYVLKLDSRGDRLWEIGLGGQSPFVTP